MKNGAFYSIRQMLESKRLRVMDCNHPPMLPYTELHTLTVTLPVPPTLAGGCPHQCVTVPPTLASGCHPSVWLYHPNPYEWFVTHPGEWLAQQAGPPGTAT